MQSTHRKILQHIKLAIFDVDGVLTTGHLHYGPEGELIKVFHVHDGHGLKELMQHGIEVAIISGRKCAALEIRLQELGITHYYLGQGKKGPALHDLLEKTGIKAEHACYTGDDIPDIAPMQAVGFSFAPANAVAEVKNIAQWSCQKSGGHGAVREISDLLIACLNT